MNGTSIRLNSNLTFTSNNHCSTWVLLGDIDYKVVTQPPVILVMYMTSSTAMLELWLLEPKLAVQCTTPQKQK